MQKVPTLRLSIFSFELYDRSAYFIKNKTYIVKIKLYRGIKSTFKNYRSHILIWTFYYNYNIAKTNMDIFT